MRTTSFARLTLALASILAVGGSGATQIGPQSRILQPIDATQVAAIKGTASPRAQAPFDVGRTDATRTISGAITFRLSAAQQADLDKLLREQQDPSSPNYHRWLTPDQYAARFGMSQSDLAKVGAWLQSQGLNVDGISRNHNEIRFNGSAGQVEYAFKTRLRDYVIKGEQHFANASNVSLPTAFSAEVLNVRGLNDFRPKPRVRKLSPKLTSSISGNHFVVPGDFATIYNVPSNYTGAGQSIAVVGQTAISNTDIDAFRSNAGLAANDPTVVLVPNTGSLAHSAGDETEADLDLEWSGAVAPAASIIYVTVGNNTNFSVFDSVTYAVQNDVAPIISISYGNCEANLGPSFVQSMQQLAQQANAQGQTISGPAGDSGAADCDLGVATQGLQVDVPAAIPEVTGVGGSEFTGDAAGTISGSCANATQYWSGSCSTSSPAATALSYIPEMTWNDTTVSLAAGGGLSASGGGASTIFGKPSWQAGTGVPTDGKRDVPDIAFNGSNVHDSYLICSQDELTTIDPGATSCAIGFRDSNSNFAAVGGTSAGVPTFAGVVALLNQATSSSGLGNVNPMLYALAASNSQNHAFHDITSGNNMVPCTSGSTNCPSGTTSIGFSAGTGYDRVTGLGSLDVGNLITAWLAVTPTADFSLGGSTSTISAPGGSGSATVTVTALNGFAGTVNLTCAGSAAAQISCSLNPTSLDMSTGTTNNTATATLSITTVAELQMPSPWHRRGTLFGATGGLFAAVILGGIPLRRRRRWLAVLGLVLCVAVLVGVGCGGGSSGGGGNSGTPAGTYSITVTGTSGSTVHGATVSLTVQ
jgi:subtilase family serine protease